MLDRAVSAVLTAYPLVLAACRLRPRRGPRGRGLGERSASLLQHLDPLVPMGAGDLAARAGVTPATVSLQLNRLTRMRLIQRSRDPADARRVLVRLTDEGARRRVTGSLLDPERVRAALTRLEPGERDSVIAGLSALARAAAELRSRGGMGESRSPSWREDNG